MLEDDFRHCRAVTEASRSNLWLVGRALPALKHRLFTAAYASMRVIDDVVDEGYLGLAEGERAGRRGEIESTVDRWVEQAQRAAAGQFHAEACSYEPAIFRALDATLGRSGLGAGPWEALGRAMKDDLDERRLATWDDFLRYCEGATVAPSQIFLYVLACETRGIEGEGKGGLCRYVHDESLPLAEAAYQMGVFCYLVHIGRDLKKDALAGGEQLVTLPGELLGAHGLGGGGVREAFLAGDLASLVPLLGEVAGWAEGYRERSEAYLEQLRPALRRRERSILEVLLGFYLTLHDRLREQPERALRGEELLTMGEKVKLLGKVGLGI